MRGRGALSNGIFAALFFILRTNAAAITFDDGLVHAIDAGNSFPFEGVDVFDGPAATHTVVLMLEGGEIGSEFQQGFLFAYDSSIVSMSGGAIVGELSAQDSSEIFLSGGTIDQGLYARGDSTIAISGGNFNILNAQQGSNSTISISGGTGYLRAEGISSAVVTMSGGTLGWAELASDSSFKYVGWPHQRTRAGDQQHLCWGQGRH